MLESDMTAIEYVVSERVRRFGRPTAQTTKIPTHLHLIASVLVLRVSRPRIGWTPAPPQRWLGLTQTMMVLVSGEHGNVDKSINQILTERHPPAIPVKPIIDTLTPVPYSHLARSHDLQHIDNYADDEKTKQILLSGYKWLHFGHLYFTGPSRNLTQRMGCTCTERAPGTPPRSFRISPSVCHPPPPNA